VRVKKKLTAKNIYEVVYKSGPFLVRNLVLYDRVHVNETGIPFFHSLAEWKTVSVRTLQCTSISRANTNHQLFRDLSPGKTKY
jgi:hypothetical protein